METPPQSPYNYPSNAPTPIVKVNTPNNPDAPTPIVFAPNELENENEFINRLNSLNPNDVLGFNVNNLPKNLKDILLERKLAIINNTFGIRNNNLLKEFNTTDRGGRRSKKSKKKKSKKRKSRRNKRK
jgi:hypothetical protein